MPKEACSTNLGAVWKNARIAICNPGAVVVHGRAPIRRTIAKEGKKERHEPDHSTPPQLETRHWGGSRQQRLIRAWVNRCTPLRLAAAIWHMLAREDHATKKEIVAKPEGAPKNYKPSDPLW